MATTDKCELCTVAQAAAMLGVHPSTIWRWIDAERMPAYRVGPKSIRIKRGDLDQIVRPAKAEAAATASSRPEGAPASTGARHRPDEERDRMLAWLDEVAAHLEEQRARRGGVPLTVSWEDINKARDERSQQLLAL